MSEKTRSIENLTLDEIGNAHEKFKGNFVEKIDTIKTSLIEINKQGTGFFTELDGLLTELISSKNSIQEKIKSLEKEKKELLDDIKKLQT